MPPNTALERNSDTRHREQACHRALAFDLGKLARFWLELRHYKPMIQSTDEKVSRAGCPAQPVVQFRLIPLAIPCCILAAMTLLGCRSVQVDPAAEAVKQSDQLYQVYLTGDLGRAKSSLEETIRVIENANLKPERQANMIFFAYARLYVLERRTSTRAIAEVDLVKARYWFLREHEFSGETVAQAGAAVQSLTADKCMDFVDKWDKQRTDGVGPRYTQELIYVK